MTTVTVGDAVKFIGFTDADDIPENGNLLVEGEVYTVIRIEEPENPTEAEGYFVQVPNPDYKEGSRKKAEKIEFFEVDIFADEFEAVGGAAEEAAEEAEAETESYAWDDIQEGDTVLLHTTEGDLEGTVTRKLKTKLTLANAEGEEMNVPKKTVDRIGAVKAEEEVAEVAEEAVEEVKPKAKATKKATTVVEADEEKEKGITLTAEQDDEEIVALVEGTDDICGLAESLAEQANHVEYQLGGVLYHVRKSGAYQELAEHYADKGGFEAYCEERLGVGYRKAMYLIEIYTVWNYHGIDPRKLTELGWSKAQVIAKAMNEENKDALIQAAETNSVRDLKDVVKEDFLDAPQSNTERVARTTFKFRLFEDQAEVVKPILEDAAEYLGLDSLDQVFEHICTEWAQEHLNVGKKKRK